EGWGPLRQGRAGDRAFDAQRAAAPAEPGRDVRAAGLACAPLRGARRADDLEPADVVAAVGGGAGRGALDRDAAGEAGRPRPSLPGGRETESLRRAASA